jgi:sporulation protein YlmC with PRC-barrel domain
MNITSGNLMPEPVPAKTAGASPRYPFCAEIAAPFPGDPTGYRASEGKSGADSPQEEESMALPDIDTVLEWRGRTVVDRQGEKIGKFDEIYLDEETSKPEWAAVTTGLFGRKQSFIPLSEAQLAGDDVQVPFDKEQVKDAPIVDPEDELSQDEEERLYRHYGLGYSRSESGTVLPEDAESGAGSTAGSTPETPDDERSTPDAEGAQDQRGDRPQVGTTARPRERVRLKKYIVTEEVTRTVPVSREEGGSRSSEVDEPERRG